MAGFELLVFGTVPTVSSTAHWHAFSCHERGALSSLRIYSLWNSRTRQRSQRLMCSVRNYSSASLIFVSGIDDYNLKISHFFSHLLFTLFSVDNRAGGGGATAFGGQPSYGSVSNMGGMAPKESPFGMGSPGGAKPVFGGAPAFGE